MNNDLFNTVNLKDLPQLEQILPGNFLVVENTAGTNKLDFSDFIIGPSNTSFYTPIANNIISLSSSTIQLSANLAAVSASNETYFKEATSFAINNINTKIIEVTGALTEKTIILTKGSMELSPSQTITRSEYFPNSCIEGGVFNVYLRIVDEEERIRLLTQTTFTWRFAITGVTDVDFPNYSQIVLRPSVTYGSVSPTLPSLTFDFQIINIVNIPFLDASDLG